MPVLKTRKAVAKRIKITKRLKVKIKRAFKGHLLTQKSRKRKRQLKQRGLLLKKEAKKLLAMVPYGK